jgi:tetratricopeptide (TPR) repeat protein
MPWKTGVLFLFDVKGSTEIVNACNEPGQKIFYDHITTIVKNTIDSINIDTTRVSIVQSTGDGYYLFSEDAEISILLFLALINNFSIYQFNGRLIQIRCGATYGKVHIDTNSLQKLSGDLANLTARVCAKADINELIINNSLYELIKSNLLISLIDLEINNLNLKDLKGIGKVHLWSIRKKNTLNITNEIFVGRNAILSEFTQLAKKSFEKNRSIIILGQSGVGKTSLAEAAINKYRLGICVLVDLRKIKNMYSFHQTLLNKVWYEIPNSIQKNYALYHDYQSTILLALSVPEKEVIFVIDHAEELSKPQHNEMKRFLFSMYDKIRIILTSTKNYKSAFLDFYELHNPNDEEKTEMLSYWIDTRKVWLSLIAKQITNHTYLIVLLGRQYKGVYKTKDELQNKIRRQITQNMDVTGFLKNIIDDQCQSVIGWLCLASICNGFVYTSTIPNKDQILLLDSGLSKKNGIELIFHPLVIQAIRNRFQKKEIVSNVITHLNEIPYDALNEYYKYLIYRFEGNAEEEVKIIVRNSWQTWAEEVDSFKSLAAIDAVITNYNLSVEELSLYRFFQCVIRIFQGLSDDLKVSVEIFMDMSKHTDVPEIMKLISIAESIECQRKLNGNKKAFSEVLVNLNKINNLLKTVIVPSYKYYEKDYFIGSFYFLMGNILRSAEYENNAIEFYRKAMYYINNCCKKIYNSELQKMHITYGIAEAYLKTNQIDRAIEIVDEYLHSNSSGAKFGKALIFLLMARAYLAKGVSFFEPGCKAVIKAKNLFNEIRLPYYIERCNFVLAALYIRKGEQKAGLKLLNKIIDDKTDTGSLIIRANIFVRYINKSDTLCTKDEINKITDHRGKTIGKFYADLVGIDLDVELENTITFHLNGDYLETLVDKNKGSGLRKLSWIVD